jgi:hypothetical protein
VQPVTATARTETTVTGVVLELDIAHAEMLVDLLGFMPDSSWPALRTALNDAGFYHDRWRHTKRVCRSRADGFTFDRA